MSWISGDMGPSADHTVLDSSSECTADDCDCGHCGDDEG